MSGLKCFWRKMGAFLVDILRLDQPEKGRGTLQKELTALQVGRKETIRAYWIRKICCVLAAGMIGILLAAVSFGWSMLRREDVPDQALQRPAYGEGNRTEALEAEIDGEEVQAFEITVRERAYTEAEKQQHLEAAILTLDETLPGENNSLDEVRQDLAFPETLEDGAVQVCWTTVPYGVIDESGRLLGSEDVDGVLVEIQGTLTCGGKEALYTVYAKVFPQEMPKEEQLHQSILNELSREDSEHGSKAILELPAEVDGRKLYWLYLISGKPSDRKNLKYVVKRLLFLREGLNYQYCLQHQNLTGAAGELALALTGMFGMPALTGAMQHALLLGLAYGESLLDVRILLSGGKIPLLKDAASWKLSFETLGSLGNLLERVDGSETEEGLSYTDYLRILLQMCRRPDLKLRALDLIQYRLQKQEGSECFQAQNAIVAIKTEAKWSCRPVFYSLPQAVFGLGAGGTNIWQSGSIAY